MKKHLSWVLAVVMAVLSLTGYVVPAEAYTYGQRTLYQGLRGGDVWQLQKNLETLKYNPGKVDGVFGYATRLSVVRFQRDYGLTADGKVGQNTFAKINQRIAAASVSRGNYKPNTGRVNVDNANIRSGPGVWNKIVTVVKKGALVTILSQQGNWLKTKLADSTIGWIAAKLITVDKSTSVSRGQEPDRRPEAPKPPANQPEKPSQPQPPQNQQPQPQPQPEKPQSPQNPSEKPQPQQPVPSNPTPSPQQPGNLPPGSGQPQKPEQPQTPETPTKPTPQPLPPIQPEPETTKKVRNVLGFFTNPEGTIPGSLPTVQAQGEAISSVAPFWFRLDRNKQGKVAAFENLDGFNQTKAKAAINEMKNGKVKVLALIHNMLYGSSSVSKNLASQMLANQASRKVFIDDVLKLIKDYGFDGINLDIEDINVADRDKFSALVSELKNAMKADGYILTVSVPAKVREDKSNTWSAPFDYAAIGKAADQVILMTYDEHGYSSGPGPIASVSWVEAVIKYALTTIPAEKIMMGIPSYGFDWTEGVKGPKYLSFEMAMNLAKQYQKTVLWDAKGKAPYFIYSSADGKKHQVWFENAQSTEAKIDLLDKYNLKGIALWRLGMEDQAAWQVIKNRIEAEK